MKLLDVDKLKNSRGFFELKPSGIHAVYIHSLSALVAAALIWSFFFEADEILKTTAVIRPNDHVSSVAVLVSGELVEKHYENNRLVAAGELLWVTDTRSQRVRLDNLNSDLNQAAQDIENSRMLLDSIRFGKNRVPRRFNEAWLMAETFFSERNRFVKQLEITEDQVVREKEKPDYLKVPKVIADLEAEYAQLKMSFASWKSSQESLAEAQLKMARQNKRTLESSIADLEKSIRDAAVYSPITGQVAEVKKVNLRDMVFAGDILVKIVPVAGNSLKAEIMVDNSRIARVREGQKIKIRFKGLPAAEFGQLQGRITMVPADASGSDAQGSPFFMVEAEIDNPVLISRRGERVTIRPGMVAEVRIVLSRKTIMQFVLNKLNFLF